MLKSRLVLSGMWGLPAVHSDRMIAWLLLLLLHCGDYVDHAFAVRGDAHLRPAVEMELTHRSSLVLLDRRRGTRGRDQYRLNIIRLLVLAKLDFEKRKLVSVWIYFYRCLLEWTAYSKRGLCFIWPSEESTGFLQKPRKCLQCWISTNWEIELTKFSLK